MTIPFDQIKKALRKDPEYVKAYDALSEEFKIATLLIQARLKASMTQTDVARKMKTTQSAIARLEGGLTNPTLKFLNRYAQAIGQTLTFSIMPH